MSNFSFFRLDHFQDFVVCEKKKRKECIACSYYCLCSWIFFNVFNLPSSSFVAFHFFKVSKKSRYIESAVKQNLTIICCNNDTKIMILKKTMEYFLKRIKIY